MSILVEKLMADLHIARRDLAEAEATEALLRWKIQYIETLLASAKQNGSQTSAVTGAPDAGGLKLALHKGMTIIEAAQEVLREAGQPLPCIEIARRAMERGFPEDNIERARSHFSAVISKDLRSSDPRFWQYGRGRIALPEWRQRMIAEAEVGGRPELESDLLERS